MSVTSSAPFKKDQCPVSMGARPSADGHYLSFSLTQALGSYEAPSSPSPRSPARCTGVPPALACLPLKHHAPLTNPPLCCPSGQSSWKSFQAASPRPLSLLTLSSSLLFAFPERSHDHDASGFQIHLCAYNSHIYTSLQGISLDSHLRLKTPCIILYNLTLGFPYIIYHCTMSKIKASMSSLK